MNLETHAPHAKDLGGGFVVRRLLPQLRRPAVGPFVFFDHFGPIQVQPADHHDVRAHPHIGLATVTYLFAGAMLHRDSTGVTQRIEPGAINWMSAGRGIVHSERRPADLQGRAYPIHGLQLWVALPAELETSEPAFEHTPAERIPQRDGGGATVRVLVGQAHGLRSPVSARSPTLFVEYRLAPGASVELPTPEDAIERGLYGVEGGLALTSQSGTTAVQRVEPGRLVVLDAAVRCRLHGGESGAHVVLVGGAPLGHRYLWWNFVATEPALIERAAAAWEADTFGAVAGEEQDRIPLPAVRFRSRGG